MLPSYLLPTLPDQEGVIPRPGLGRPAELRNDVSCYDIGRRIVSLGGLISIGEGDTILINQQNGG